MKQENEDIPFGPNWARDLKARLGTLQWQFEEAKGFREKNRIFDLMKGVEEELRRHGYSSSSDLSDLDRSRLPTVQEAAASLKPLEKVRIMQPSWGEILSMYGETGHLGEVRYPDDWERLPRKQELRAVYVPDERGGTIRWADDYAMSNVLGGGVGSLVREDVTGVREGYVLVSEAGAVKLQA